jgi:hypothetical protein
MTINSDAVLRRDVRGILNLLLPFAGAGGFAIVAFSATRENTLSTIGYSVAVSVGAAAVGALLGFVFGVPRGMRAQTTDTSRRYSGNSNLEDVSDWLAKLLIGAGLTQVGQLATGLYDFAKLIAPEATPTATAYMLALIVAFTTFGFFFSYLFARRVLPAIFLRADDDGSDHAKQTLDSAKLMLDAGVNINTVRQVLAEPLKEIASAQGDTLSADDKVLVAKARALTGAPGGTKDLVDVAKAAPEDEQLRDFAVLSALYDKEPDGYRKAIDLGEKVENKSPRLHMYLASAWGQKHGANDGGLEESKQKVLEHVRAALQGDPSLKGTIVPMLDERNHDNDLSSLAADPDLKTLLGLGQIRIA